jgi:hypothetical protein
MRAAGESVARVEIDREGKIVVFIGAPACAESEKRLAPEQEATERFFTKQGQAK